MKEAYLRNLTPGQIRYCLNMASMYPGCWRAMVLSAAKRAVGAHPTAVGLIRRISFQGLMALTLPDLREALSTHTQEVSHG